MMQTYFTTISAFLLSLIGISTNRAHLMSMLLCMESMTLILFLSMAASSINNTNTTSITIIMIAMGACEASAGLTLMTITTQKNTNDYVKNLNLLKC
uniref:NADH-ubiquinone oxidoreductase chain 4L n=1 Tax=Phrynocephalus helioscopus TaxID=171647 RepID=A0A0U1XN73_9SAUR|nr:NADH dehydrogenase subunit 4L [Phrynocephalus helioscopus]AIU56758.1 NADH dehydrogenase subunit 4L [Phrynocephalus helioscopus]